MSVEFIDCHTHAYLDKDLTALAGRLSFLDGQLAEDDPHRWKVVHDGRLESVIDSERQAGVSRLVLLPVAGKPSRVAELNQWTAEAAQTYPEVIPFATLHPQSETLADDLAQVRDLGLKGVKLHSILQRFELLSSESLALVEEIARLELPIMLDTLHGPGLLAVKPHLGLFAAEFRDCATDPTQIATLADRFPQLTFIAAHLGCLYGWDEIDPLMDRSNVYIDTSYVNRLVSAERAAAIIKRKGTDRVLWGTDTPWRRVGPAKDWFLSLDLTDQEIEAVAAGNLKRLLGI